MAGAAHSTRLAMDPDAANDGNNIGSAPSELAYCAANSSDAARGPEERVGIMCERQ
jgi:hypothetical protein